jgi:hypothetical protein
MPALLRGAGMAPKDATPRAAGFSGSAPPSSGASARKLFTKRPRRDVARQQFPDIRIEGDFSHGGNVLDMVSVA